MAGTKTAPDVSAVPATVVYTTLGIVDASGDNFAVTLKTATAPALVDVQDFATKYQATTQGSVWYISQDSVWLGDEDPDNATTDVRFGVQNGINLLFRLGANSNTYRVVAPVTGALQGNQDIPLLTYQPMVDLITDIISLTGESLASAQYTSRTERKNNPRVKA